MNREEMIRRLVAYSVDAALREPQSYWLQEVFEKGFSGYRRFSDERLRREMALRGLGETDEAYADEDVDDWIPDEVPSLTPLSARGFEAD